MNSIFSFKLKMIEIKFLKNLKNLKKSKQNLKKSKKFKSNSNFSFKLKGLK